MILIVLYCARLVQIIFNRWSVLRQMAIINETKYHRWGSSSFHSCDVFVQFNLLPSECEVFYHQPGLIAAFMLFMFENNFINDSQIFWVTKFIVFIRCISKNSKLAQRSPFFCLQTVKSERRHYLDSHILGTTKNSRKQVIILDRIKSNLSPSQPTTNSSLSIAHIVVLVLVQKKKSKINLASAAARVLTNTKKMDHIGPKRSIVYVYYWNQEWKHSCWSALNINPKYYLIGYFISCSN